MNYLIKLLKSNREAAYLPLSFNNIAIR